MKEEVDDKENTSRLIAEFRRELNQLKGIISRPKIEEAQEEFDEYLQAGYSVLVAEDGEIEGFLVCRISDNILWVESLYVCNNVRRKGIASKLYKEAEKMQKKWGRN